MTVAEYISQRIKREKVEYVFGYQGGSVIEIIKSICKASGLNYIQAFHEQAAGFEADAYSRITGNFGVCVVTNGPGLTNAISAIADAYYDFVPMLVLSGQVKTTDKNNNPKIRQNAFQEVDSVALCSPITKYAKTIPDASVLPEELEKAIRIAKTPPFGPVLIDIPIDLQKAIVPEASFPDNSLDAPVTDYSSDIAALTDLLNASSRPVIIAGGGIRQGDAYEELCEFASLTGVPVARTLAGLDLITDTDLGFCGLYGTPAANKAINQADLLVVLGSRLAKRQVGIPEKYAPRAKVFHADINSAELGHVRKEDYSVCTLIKPFLSAANRYFKEKNVKYDFSEWKRTISGYVDMHSADVEMNSSSPVKPYSILRRLSSVLPDTATITLDVGQNQMWCAQGLKCKKGQRVISSGGLGCMGFSLPAGIGAFYATGKPIYSFMGDGGSQMNIQELQYISSTQIPVKIFIFNNRGLGMIQEVQMKFSDKEYFGSVIGYSTPPYQGLAETYGIQYIKLCSNDDIEGKDFLTLLENNKPAIIEMNLDCSPMRLLTMYDNINIYE